MDSTVHDSVGNVFEDLGLPHADERLANAERIRLIRKRIQSGELDRDRAAEIAGFSADEFAAALRGRFSLPSAERIARLAQAIGIP